MAASINLLFFAPFKLSTQNVNELCECQQCNQCKLSQLISNGDSKNYILLDISMIAWSVWIECKPIWFKLDRTLDHYFYWQDASRFVFFFPQWSWHLAYHQFIVDFNWNTSDLCCNISPREQSREGCLDVVRWDCKSISSWGQNITQHPLNSQQRSVITH